MKKKRGYRSMSREIQATQTRAQILDSAMQLFKAEGFEKVTLNQLAKAANVSAPTLYALFKSKRGILQSLIDTALPPEQFTSLVDDSMQEKSPQKRLSLTAKLARQIYDAEREMIDLLRGASFLSPELKELEQERERRRYKRQSDYVKKLLKDGALAKGLTLEKARDILWTLTGRDLYRLLVIERRWSSDQYEQWLTDLLIKSLLKID